MSEVEDHIDDVDEPDETMVRFIMTLIVATVIVAVSGYALSRVVYAPERTVHGAAVQTQYCPLLTERAPDQLHASL